MADQIAETGIRTEVFENKNQVKLEAAKISETERIDLRTKLVALNAAQNIPENGLILDVGPGSGALGVLVAESRNSSLIQADVTDLRTYKVGDLIALTAAEPPNLSNIKADVALLVDVIHHVGYGNGWNNETKTPNIQGRVDDCLKFIGGVETGLKPEGKILIVNTREEAKGLIEKLKERITQDPTLGEKIKIL